ncbi:hypothetical protein O181_028565 [Austropuccinia psidii MF-1]|uniref:Uncharacterized protein n=1 Tax=Austropuccinia psidii MF-1 TaxID=1389203 RepID=A0A9Q3CSY3_9BASI|nr:hypothetical protein [Austropuccinia psidii MF-1]
MIQNSPPAKNTRSQRNKAFITPKERAPLDYTPSVHQLSANLDRGPPMEGAAPSRRGGPRSRLGEAEYEEGQESVKEEESEETEVAAALEGASKTSEAANLAHCNKPLVSQAEPNFIKMRKLMNQFMGHLTQEVNLRENSRASEFKTPSIKAPDYFDGTQAYKLRALIQSCNLILHNNPERLFSDRKKNWKLGERAYIHVYRRGLTSILLEKLASHLGNLDILQELIDITLEVDTRYHERQKEKGGHQDKKPPVTGSNPSRPPQDSSSKRPHHKKGKNFHVSKDKPHAALLNT